jgi:NADPH:quinone reductase-like Zn-dependent oxidoreductase
MRAIRYDRHGPPDVLHVADVPAPEAAAGQVLVEVHGAGVGGGELLVRAGKLRPVLRLKLPQGAGNDFAGRVAAVGPGVERVRPGDAVWGVLPPRTFGSIVELVAVPERYVVAAPRDVDLVEAAALPSVGTTAITALTDKAQLRGGERLLVRGATGGVGSVAVQLGRALGAHVTALAGAQNLAWIRELGADVALDHRATRPQDLDRFDVVVDLVGADVRAYAARLARGGRIVPLALDGDHLLRSLAAMGALAAAGPRRVRGFSNDPSTERIAELTRHVEAGTIRPLVAAVFALDEVAEAHRRLEAGGVRGRYVIDVRR